jgi:hypothetical protein
MVTCNKGGIDIVKTASLIALILSFVIPWSCSEKNDSKLASKDIQKLSEESVIDKYKDIKSFEQLMIAFDIFRNENCAIYRRGIESEVINHTYRLEEKIYLMQALAKYLDQYPNIVIPKLISLMQYSGAADGEYLHETLAQYFDREPKKFITAVNRDAIRQNLEPEFLNEEFINHIYLSLSEPLSEEYVELGGDKKAQREYIIAKIKGLNISNDFYRFLQKEYNF